MNEKNHIIMSNLMKYASTMHNVFLDCFIIGITKALQDGVYSYCNHASHLQHVKTVMITQQIFFILKKELNHSKKQFFTGSLLKQICMSM